MNYRAGVGPPENYDILGARQFAVLLDEGLREYHYLLDVGCGSIRGGKLYIPYLLPGHYFGIEPNAELVNEGIKNELNEDFVFIQKKATFWFDDRFELAGFPGRPKYFDFILAQSIFSHTSRKQTEKCIAQVAEILSDDGKFLGTWFIGPHNWDKEGWKPGSVVTRPQTYLGKIAGDVGLSFERLDYKHPSGQTWFRMMLK